MVWHSGYWPESAIAIAGKTFRQIKMPWRDDRSIDSIPGTFVRRTYGRPRTTRSQYIIQRLSARRVEAQKRFFRVRDQSIRSFIKALTVPNCQLLPVLKNSLSCDKVISGFAILLLLWEWYPTSSTLFYQPWLSLKALPGYHLTHYSESKYSVFTISVPLSRWKPLSF